MSVLLTDTDFLRRYDGRGAVFLDAGVRVSSAVDWKHEVIAVGASECPVHVVARVSGALEGQGQRPVVVRHGSVLHVLCVVFSRRREAIVTYPSVQ